ASHYGFPISTTHEINGGVMGAGAAKRVSAVRWGVAGNIVVAWMVTLPAAAIMAAAIWEATQALGGGLSGPLVLFTAAILTVLLVLVRRRAHLVPAPGS
ncbi:MAG: inorganic phosphate transporter, partial [Solirubrobacterales bacterium]|nr:inorganic phosphate transporter [Solirubrobacterales bacterium]